MLGKLAQYTLIKEIGAGYFGTVYLAVGKVPGRGPAPPKRRLVAIKKLNDNTDQESVYLLLREFSLLDQVKHRCIVRVFEYIKKHNAVVMEYIHGVELRQIIDDMRAKKQRVFTEASIELVCELADALYQAYTTPGDNGEALQLVHRDIKPANIILTPSGEVKILDFGLARVDNSEFTREQNDQIRGTPIYMAPEQVQGLHLDHRTDLFALSLIFYELLTGKPAYHIPVNASDPLAEIFRDISAGKFSFNLWNLERELPMVGSVLQKSLQQDPSRRHQNGQELLVALRQKLYDAHGESLKNFAGFYFQSIRPLEEAPTLHKIDSELLHNRDIPSHKSPQARSVPEKKSIPEVANIPKRPPVGGGASRNRPGRFSAQNAANSGVRKPSEPGILSFVPEQQEDDDAGSSTEFFAISPPKQQKKRDNSSQVPPPPPSGLNSALHSGNYALQNSGYQPPLDNYPPQQYNAPPNNFQASGNHQHPINHQHRESFNQSANFPPNNHIGSGRLDNSPNYLPPVHSHSSDEEEGQSTSYKMYAVLLTMFGIILIAAVVAVYLILNPTENPNEQPENSSSTASVNFEREDDIRLAQVNKPQETPALEKAEEPQKTKQSTKPRRTRQSKQTKQTKQTKQSKQPKQPKQPKVRTGTLTLRVPDCKNCGGVDIVCDGKRARGTRVDGGFVFNNVTTGKCKVKFKPSDTTWVGTVRPGSMTCSLSGGGPATCQ